MDTNTIKNQITQMLSDRNAGGYSKKLWDLAKKEYRRNILIDDSGEEFDLHAEEREAFYWGLECAYQDILKSL